MTVHIRTCQETVTDHFCIRNDGSSAPSHNKKCLSTLNEKDYLFLCLSTSNPSTAAAPAAFNAILKSLA